MNETRVQRASLVGQVIEDLTYGALSPGQFEAQLSGTKAVPQYKAGGFFVFFDIRPGTYDLRLSGRSFQPQDYQVTIPLQTPIFYPPGDNELLVVVKTINDGGKKITFDPVILTREIRAGAAVLAQGFAAKLTTTLEAGKAMEARLDDVTKLTVGSIVRIIRGSSIRLKFTPYTQLQAESTRIIGKITLQDANDIPLQGVQVSLTGVNDNNIIVQHIANADIATVETGGIKLILGTQKDITTFSNIAGDYNLYFSNGDEFQNITLTAISEGYQTQLLKAIAITAGRRNKIDFQLVKAEG